MYSCSQGPIPRSDCQSGDDDQGQGVEDDVRPGQESGDPGDRGENSSGSGGESRDLRF
ncbi:MAG: hypothetical protein MZV63_26140 [Marinilabiliales bacterium]|nr:hypothetical protein [Marinilabiliales bacterium]